MWPKWSHVEHLGGYIDSITTSASRHDYRN